MSSVKRNEPAPSRETQLPHNKISSLYIGCPVDPARSIRIPACFRKFLKRGTVRSDWRSTLCFRGLVWAWPPSPVPNALGRIGRDEGLHGDISVHQRLPSGAWDVGERRWLKTGTQKYTVSQAGLCHLAKIMYSVNEVRFFSAPHCAPTSSWTWVLWSPGIP